MLVTLYFVQLVIEPFCNQNAQWYLYTFQCKDFLFQDI